MSDEFISGQLFKHGYFSFLSVKHVGVRGGQLLPMSLTYHLEVEITFTDFDQDRFHLGLEILLGETFSGVNFIIHGRQEGI